VLCPEPDCCGCDPPNQLYSPACKSKLGNLGTGAEAAPPPEADDEAEGIGGTAVLEEDDAESYRAPSNPVAAAECGWPMPTLGPPSCLKAGPCGGGGGDGRYWLLLAMLCAYCDGLGDGGGMAPCGIGARAGAAASPPGP